MLKLQLLDQNQEFIYSMQSTSTGLLALKQGKLHLGARSVEVWERRWCHGKGAVLVSLLSHVAAKGRLTCHNLFAFFLW